MLNIIEADITAHNERGNPIPAEIKLLLILRYYATGTFQEACGDLCDISHRLQVALLITQTPLILTLQPLLSAPHWNVTQV